MKSTATLSQYRTLKTHLKII